jgi:hypothetical protein
MKIFGLEEKTFKLSLASLVYCSVRLLIYVGYCGAGGDANPWI